MVSEDIRERVVSYIRYQAEKPAAAVLDLVRTSQQKYIDIVAGVDDELAARKPAPEEWSVRELTRHVIDAQEGVVHLVRHLARDEAPPPRPARSGIGSMIEDDDAPFPALVERLRATNGAMLTTLRELPDPPAAGMTRPHPFFGELTAMQWAVFQRVHDEDHVQHVRKILAAV